MSPLVDCDGAESDDLATVAARSDLGLSVLTARASEGYSWQSFALLTVPGVETSQWIGNACTTSDGTMLAAVYAPREVTNSEAGYDDGAYTAVVDLRTGDVTNLGLGHSIDGCRPPRRGRRIHLSDSRDDPSKQDRHNTSLASHVYSAERGLQVTVGAVSLFGVRIRAPRTITVSVTAAFALFFFSGCATPKIDGFVYSDAAYRVHHLGGYLGRVFVTKNTLTDVEKQFHEDAHSMPPKIEIWDEKRSDFASGGDWITEVDAGPSDFDMVTGALVTIPGELSGGLFSSRPASVLLCVRYLGELGSEEVHVVDAECPDGIEARLPSFQRVTVDQIADYEVDE